MNRFIFSSKARLSSLNLTLVVFFFVLGFIGAGYSLFKKHPEWIQTWKSHLPVFQGKSLTSLETRERIPAHQPMPSDLPEECLMPIIAKVEEPSACQGRAKEESGWSLFQVFSREPQPTVYKPNPFPWPKRFTLSHIVGNRGKIDFSSNYSSASFLFAPDFQCGSFLPILDVQGHRFDDTTYAATAGLILRYIPTTQSAVQEIAGLNVYYDYRQGSIGYYQQFSIGLEILAERWETRANGYIPFGDKKSIETCEESDFGCDKIADRNYRDVSYGFSAEVGGYPVKTPSFLVYIAGGSYFLSGRHCKANTVGGEGRLRPQFRDFIALDLSYSWDPLFQSIYQAEVILYAPLYQIGKRRPLGECARGLTMRQIYQNVERFDVMPLGRRTCRRP